MSFEVVYPWIVLLAAIILGARYVRDALRARLFPDAVALVVKRALQGDDVNRALKVMYGLRERPIAVAMHAALVAAMTRAPSLEGTAGYREGGTTDAATLLAPVRAAFEASLADVRRPIAQQRVAAGLSTVTLSLLFGARAGAYAETITASVALVALRLLALAAWVDLHIAHDGARLYAALEPELEAVVRGATRPEHTPSIEVLRHIEALGASNDGPRRASR